MKFVRTEKIKLGKNIFLVRNSNRAIIRYEEINNKQEVSTFEDGLKWFYATAWAGAHHAKINFPYTWETFLDLIDDNTEAAQVFAQAFGLNLQEQKAEKKKILHQLLILASYTAFVVATWELIRFIF